jgi:hypothetical protein
MIDIALGLLFASIGIVFLYFAETEKELWK